MKNGDEVVITNGFGFTTHGVYIADCPHEKFMCYVKFIRSDNSERIEKLLKTQVEKKEIKFMTINEAEEFITKKTGFQTFIKKVKIEI